ncbi:MerC domain-containing protein [Sphingobium algorifonticola]|uniref:MerC domain-containing protein n=1 Tax=Sphingobium algorifonticola TaxID=2008318 RepID=A0A437J5Z5_9SPHN|nr:MerC domain-containing protein [Sphingobium algorifonticola]RVT40203.1 MerC domain-containing protein [Sphingobium algorifonticola]
MLLSLRSALARGSLDRVAVALSGLCAAHCIVTALVLGVLASAGGIFDNPLFHEVGLVIAIVLGGVALGHGAMKHGFMIPAAIGALGLGVMAGALSMDHGLEESLYTLIGVAILALGHDLNHRAGH